MLLTVGKCRKVDGVDISRVQWSVWVGIGGEERAENDRLLL